MYSATTHTIAVTVEPTYLDSESEPEKNIYVWTYHVCIANTGDETVQLRSRRWTITDALGRVQEVKGDGVVGVQPVLKPGETFEYTSGTPLPTSSGIMCGTYVLQAADGRMFDVAIPAFSLDTPHLQRQVN